MNPTKVLSWIIGLLINELKKAIPDAQAAKELIDDLFDLFEDKHPLLKEAVNALRENLDIPDDIGGDPD